MDNRRKRCKHYQRRWRSASRTLKSLNTHKIVDHFEVDNSDNESFSLLVQDEHDDFLNTGLTNHTTIDSSSVVDCDLVEPITVSSDLYRSSSSSDCDSVPLLSNLLVINVQQVIIVCIGLMLWL